MKELKLKWEIIGSTVHRAYYMHQAIKAYVMLRAEPRATPKSDGYGLWEIEIGDWYYSRDRKVYYQSAEKAKRVAETLLRQIAEKLITKLTQNGGSE